MNNDIIPPRPPVNQPPRPQQRPVVARPPVTPSPAQSPAPGMPQSTPAPQPQPQQQPQTVAPAPEAVVEPAPATTAPVKPRRKTILTWVLVCLALVILLCGAAVAWYLQALRPAQTGEVDKVRVMIESGSSPAAIGKLLADKQVIRSEKAFEIYTRLSNTRNALKAGTFSLSPTESTQQVVNHLVVGAAEQYAVTFYPGATLNITSTSADKTPSHREVLEKLGFKSDEIDEAFATDYSKDYPVLFADKPASADLEGYIYGETYQVASGSSVRQILMRTFAEYEAALTAKRAELNGASLVDSFKQRDLTVYEAITLASIIQREVPTQTDQKQVAQIFYTRLGMDMMLGSDVTYHYAADKLGVARDHTLDSPYNTRRYTGLPPGPIASAGLSALIAVASPAEGDYVYFLSGDDDKTYFGRTNEEHEANIVNHCAYKCSLP